MNCKYPKVLNGTIIQVNSLKSLQILILKKLIFSECYSNWGYPERFKEFDILINIDELIISRSTSNKYYWSKKGIEAEMKSTIFTKSISIITAIFWLENILFIRILKLLTLINMLSFSKIWISSVKNKLEFKGRNTTILLGNASTHRAKKSVSFLKRRIQ